MIEGIRKMERPIMISYAFAVILLISLFVLCFEFVPDDVDYRRTISLNIAIFVAGWACGWMAGTLFAPYDENESKLFSQVSKGIWGFVSGYILAKFDKVYGILKDSGVIPLDSLSGFRTILFISVLIIVLLVVFFARKYSHWHIQPADTGVGAAE